MTYDIGKQRGVFDRSFNLTKVSFHRDAAYDVVKDRCQRAVWPDGKEDDKFYVADGSGVSIQRESFEVEGLDGSQQVIPWSLGNYLQVSHIRYPSRARLYCVKLPASKHHCIVVAHDIINMHTLISYILLTQAPSLKFYTCT